MKRTLLIFFILMVAVCFPQAYSIKAFNWKDAGYKGSKPAFSQTVNIMNYGGNNNNGAANNAAFIAALNALNNKPGVIYFPKGIYDFNTTVSFNRDSIIVKGAGSDSTELRFNMNGTLNNCFSIWGSTFSADTSSFSSPGVRDSNWVNVMNAALFQAGDWVYLQTLDNAYMASNWAYGSLGQIMQIRSKTGNKLVFNSPFRFYYKLSLQPKITKLNVRREIGFECLKIKRTDATSQQTSLISFDRAVQCWINGVEEDSTNYAHVELNRCSNIEITNSYFHHAFAYGGSGQGYGIVFQYSASECKAENNIFQNLRHSMIMQAGANGNVCGYNYSFNPYWNESFYPTNSAGDMVLHGNYPFANLFEGNINQNTVIDNSHGKNGPYNTFFRNRSELWGVVMNNSPATDTVQFLGLEVTNMSAPYGQYVIYGNGHLQFGNKVQGNLTPNAAGNLSENSLYYNGNQRPLCFANGAYNWPVIGIPDPYNTGSNPAKDRALQSIWASCNCVNIPTGFHPENNSSGISIYPNPASEKFSIDSKHPVREICIYSASGKLLSQERGRNISSCKISNLESGIYMVTARTDHSSACFRLIRE